MSATVVVPRHVDIQLVDDSGEANCDGLGPARGKAPWKPPNNKQKSAESKHWNQDRRRGKKAGCGTHPRGELREIVSQQPEAKRYVNQPKQPCRPTARTAADARMDPGRPRREPTEKEVRPQLAGQMRPAHRPAPGWNGDVDDDEQSVANAEEGPREEQSQSILRGASRLHGERATEVSGKLHGDSRAGRATRLPKPTGRVHAGAGAHDALADTPRRGAIDRGMRSEWFGGTFRHVPASKIAPGTSTTRTEPWRASRDARGDCLLT